MKAFKYIFTLPSSALKADIEGKPTAEPRRHHTVNKCHTHSHIIALLEVKSISPHVIVYIAFQVSYMLLCETVTHL